jgi:hypothetical protein
MFRTITIICNSQTYTGILFYLTTTAHIICLRLTLLINPSTANRPAPPYISQIRFTHSNNEHDSNYNRTHTFFSKAVQQPTVTSAFHALFFFGHTITSSDCVCGLLIRQMWTCAILGAFGKFRKATISFVMSIRPSVLLSAWNSSVPTGQIFMKFDIWVFFEALLRKFKFH